MTLNELECPRTPARLKHLRVGGVDTDVCEDCGGVWLDRLELAKFDRVDATFGEALVQHLTQFPAELIDHAIRLHCPRHPAVVMLRRFYSRDLRVEIDECPECGGVWLDSDELAEIRRLKLYSPTSAG
jgi:uncharacterized protein